MSAALYKDALFDTYGKVLHGKFPLVYVDIRAWFYERSYKKTESPNLTTLFLLVLIVSLFNMPAFTREKF